MTLPYRTQVYLTIRNGEIEDAAADMPVDLHVVNYDHDADGEEMLSEQHLDNDKAVPRMQAIYETIDKAEVAEVQGDIAANDLSLRQLVDY